MKSVTYNHILVRRYSLIYAAEPGKPCLFPLVTAFPSSMFIVLTFILYLAKALLFFVFFEQHEL